MSRQRQPAEPSGTEILLPGCSRGARGSQLTRGGAEGMREARRASASPRRGASALLILSSAAFLLLLCCGHLCCGAAAQETGVVPFEPGRLSGKIAAAEFGELTGGQLTGTIEFAQCVDDGVSSTRLRVPLHISSSPLRVSSATRTTSSGDARGGLPPVSEASVLAGQHHVHGSWLLRQTRAHLPPLCAPRTFLSCAVSSEPSKLVFLLLLPRGRCSSAPPDPSCPLCSQVFVKVNIVDAVSGVNCLTDPTQDPCLYQINNVHLSEDALQSRDISACGTVDNIFDPISSGARGWSTDPEDICSSTQSSALGRDSKILSCPVGGLSRKWGVLRSYFDDSLRAFNNIMGLSVLLYRLDAEGIPVIYGCAPIRFKDNCNADGQTPAPPPPPPPQTSRRVLHRLA